MRILLVSGIFPPDIGGPSSYMPALAGWLLIHGHSVQLVTLADDPASPLVLPYFAIRVRRRQWLPFRFFATFIALFRMAKNADAIFSNGLYFESAIAARLRGKRFVVKVVGDPAWERARNKGWFAGTLEQFQVSGGFARSEFFKALRSWPIRRAETVIVPSKYLQSVVQGWKIPADRVEVIYNAVEAIEESAASNQAKRSSYDIVTVCRLAPWKGVEGLLRATSRIPGINVKIAGDGPERSRLESLAEKLGVASRVLFMGAVSRRAIWELLKSSSCFVLNSSYEGLPHVVLEAMTAGIPVIATAVGGTPELVIADETGILIPPADDAALEQAIKRLAADSSLRDRLAAKALEKIREQFSFEAMMMATESAIIKG